MKTEWLGWFAKLVGAAMLFALAACAAAPGSGQSGSFGGAYGGVTGGLATH